MVKERANAKYYDNLWEVMLIDMALAVYKLRCGKYLGLNKLCTWGAVAINIWQKFPKNEYGVGSYAGKILCKDAYKRLKNRTETEELLYGPIEFLEDLKK